MPFQRTIAFQLMHLQSIINQPLMLFSGFSFIAGLRWDYENSTLKYLRETYQLSTDGARTEVKNVNSSLHFNQITPKFALQYQDERNK